LEKENADVRRLSGFPLIFLGLSALIRIIRANPRSLFSHRVLTALQKGHRTAKHAKCAKKNQN
jgi:hypothetical protein